MLLHLFRLAVVVHRAVLLILAGDVVVLIGARGFLVVFYDARLLLVSSVVFSRPVK
jgi:hypothetical protein